VAFASYLADFDVDPETNRLIDVALEMTREALGLADDFANGIIARAPVRLPDHCPNSHLPIYLKVGISAEIEKGASLGLARPLDKSSCHGHRRCPMPKAKRGGQTS
jgi:hypothetical protein